MPQRLECVDVSRSLEQIAPNRAPIVSIAPTAVFAHVVDPARPFLIVGKGQPIKVLPYRLDAGETQHAALEATQPVSPEIPAIHEYGHAHRYDDAGRSSRKQSFRKGIVFVFHGKTGPKDVLEKALE